MTFRIAAHKLRFASAVEVNCGMSVDDCVNSHVIMDSFDKAERNG